MSSHTTHTWRIESAHRTSEGLIAYQRCRCGARRVVVGDLGTSITAELGGPESGLAATA
ncbi:hypothetical protein [Nocardia mangyaensis]|uniref:hypothetical protein n=1 Tax=Nocardia mangyaensis TaxID=2213200 RepID=UPI002674F530|nr:hypothetical protein [Nocardia mangyaensis]MDO3649729.1 hypothetical protein [Nocardia mangyaensis]